VCINVNVNVKMSDINHPITSTRRNLSCVLRIAGCGSASVSGVKVDWGVWMFVSDCK
jgi:hypothetical protein